MAAKRYASSDGISESHSGPFRWLAILRPRQTDRQPVSSYSCLDLTMARTLLGFRDIDDVNLSGWSFLLVFCSNHSSKTHRLRVRGMDRQTDGSQRCLMPPLWWKGHNNTKLVHTIHCSLIVGGSYIWPSANCIAQSTGCNGGYRACGCGACMVLIGL